MKKPTSKQIAANYIEEALSLAWSKYVDSEVKQLMTEKEHNEVLDQLTKICKPFDKRLSNLITKDVRNWIITKECE